MKTKEWLGILKHGQMRGYLVALVACELDRFRNGKEKDLIYTKTLADIVKQKADPLKEDQKNLCLIDKFHNAFFMQ